MKKHDRTDFRAGAIAIVVVLVGCYLGFTKSLPFGSAYEIHAAFRTSNNIKPGSPVRIAGVEVGRVTQVRPTAPGAPSARVTMEIKDRGRPVHSDAQAKIRPRIFLEGNFFVDLSPGSPQLPELKDGGLIPATQTSTPVQFDQLLKALQRPTRDAVRKTLGELASAYDAGLAEEFRGSLEDQAPAYEFSAVVAEALLGRREHDLSAVVRDMGAVSRALDASPARLQSLLENFDTFAASVAVEQANLRDAVEELPRTLAAAGPALDALNASFPEVRHFAVAALPGVRSSGPAITALRPFVAQLRGLVDASELRGLTRDLSGATPGLVSLARGAVPLLGQLRPLSSCLNKVVIPWSRDKIVDEAFPATGPVYEEATKWLPGLAGESRSGDANGQWFKVLGGGGVETFQLGEGIFGTSLFPVAGVNPPKPTARPPLRSDVACETQETPDLRTVPGGPPASMKLDASSPEALERAAKAREVAIMILRDQLRASGTDTKVLDRDITREEIEALARQGGNLAQLEVLRKGLPLNTRNFRRASR